MAVTMNPFPLIITPLDSHHSGLGIGFGLEYAFLDSFSARFAVSYASLDLDQAKLLNLEDDEAQASIVNISLEGRWYPQQRFVEGWFFSAGFSFQLASPEAIPIMEGAHVDLGEEWVHTLSVFPGLGYKWIFRSFSRVGLSVEAMTDLGFTVLSNAPRAYLELPSSWQMGMTGTRVGIVFGVSW